MIKLHTAAAAALVMMSMACGRSEPGQAHGTPAAPAAQAPWGISVQPVALPATGDSRLPQLTGAGDRVVASWVEQTDATSTLRFAGWSGSAWGEAQRVASGDDWFVSWADVPSVLRLADGSLAAHWLKTLDPAIEVYELRLVHSEDGGRTWSRPLIPHHDGTRTQHGFASLFELPAGGVGLVWLDGRDQELDTTSAEGGDMAVYYASFDRAWKQTAEAPVNARVCECCPTSIAISSDGPIAAFRDRSDKEIRDIHVTRLEPAGWTPAVAVHDDNWEIAACPVNGPAIAARGRQVVAAWFAAAGEQGHAYAAFSQDAGRTWGMPLRLDDAESLGHVDVELLEDGSAAASWVEFAERRGRLRVRRVTPSGERSAAIEVAGTVTGVPRLARAGDALVFAWTEGSEEGEGGQHVKGAVARLPRTTAP